MNGDPAMPTTETENHPAAPMEEWDEWDEDEELGCADLEDRLDAALERAFGK